MSFQSVDEIINFYRREKRTMTNAAAIGYAILAAKGMGLTKKQLQDLEGKMRAEMDFTREEDAEEAYNKN